MDYWPNYFSLFTHDNINPQSAREGVIFDDGKTMHFNNFFRRREVILTSQTEVRGDGRSQLLDL